MYNRIKEYDKMIKKIVDNNLIDSLIQFVKIQKETNKSLKDIKKELKKLNDHSKKMIELKEKQLKAKK